MELSDDALLQMAELAAVPLRHDDLPAALDEICAISVRAIEPAAGASLTSFAERGPAVVASSDEWAKSLDETQYEEHEGPCFDAARSGVLFRVRETATDPRWPSYMPRARELGARSMLSVPVPAESKVLGALNLYARDPDAFDPPNVALAELVAGHVSLASQVASALIQHRDLARQLQEALSTRVVIEQAKGLLMATGMTGEAAFDSLRRASQRENRKLHQVAAELIAHAEQRARG